MERTGWRSNRGAGEGGEGAQETGGGEGGAEEEREGRAIGRRDRVGATTLRPGRIVVILSDVSVNSILLGLLAKIKCSICSYQFNIWYTGIPVTILNEFFWGAVLKAVLARQGTRMASVLHLCTGRSPFNDPDENTLHIN